MLNKGRQKSLLEVMAGTVVLDQVPEKPLCIAGKERAAENTSQAAWRGTHPPRVHALTSVSINIHGRTKSLREGNQCKHKIR